MVPLKGRMKIRETRQLSLGCPDTTRPVDCLPVVAVFSAVGPLEEK
jgi:hypothetical protein